MSPINILIADNQSQRDLRETQAAIITLEKYAVQIEKHIDEHRRVCEDADCPAELRLQREYCTTKKSISILKWAFGHDNIFGEVLKDIRKTLAEIEREEK